jgi:hypothetical protein
MSRSAKKGLKIVLAASVLLALGLPFIPAGLFRWRIQRALEQGLGRKVEFGAVHLSLFPGALPALGFTLDQVLIHEDPRAGIEPFAYVESLGASVRLRSLFRRGLEFSSLNLGDATINIVQTAKGPWNFQFLLASTSPNARAMPSIRMREGRVNFKFGDTKSVVYFNNADLDVAPSSDGSFELRFGGAPSRTDRAAQEFGRLFIRGASSADHQLNFQIELERTELEGTLRWMIPNDIGVHGIVSLNAQLTGSASGLNVTGNLEIGDVHRWDLLPAEGSRWRVNFAGKLNLTGERLDLVTTGDRQAITIRLRASNWLTAPVWESTAEIAQVPLSTLMKVAVHMGAAIPLAISAEGAVSGSVQYDQSQGLSGRIELGEASLRLPDAAPLRSVTAALKISGGLVRLEKTVVQAGERQLAEVEGTYALAAADPGEPHDLELAIATRGLDVSLMRSFAIAEIPVLREATAGSWRGSVRYKAGVWSGGFELRDARVAVDGIAKPIEIRSAAVALNGPRVSVTRVRARTGDLAFNADYQWDPSREPPYKFAVTIPQANAADLQDLLAPTLFREGGFLSRTLGLGSTPRPPQWLVERMAEGALAIESLALGANTIHGLSTRIRWDGTKVIAGALKASLDPGTLVGDLNIDLATALPQLHFEGRIGDLAYRGGMVDLDGTLDAGGNVRDFLASVRAEGTLRGRSIAFAPEADFRAISGDFEWQGFGPQSKWKFSNLEINQGGEVLTGSAATAGNGKLQLDLTGKGRQIRYSAALFSATGP